MTIVELLEQKFSIYVILQVKNNPGASKSQVIGVGNERTKYLRIEDMIENGIIMTDGVKREFNVMKLYLTPKGQEIANHLQKIADLDKEQ